MIKVLANADGGALCRVQLRLKVTVSHPLEKFITRFQLHYKFTIHTLNHLNERYVVYCEVTLPCVGSVMICDAIRCSSMSQELIHPSYHQHPYENQPNYKNEKLILGNVIFHQDFFELKCKKKIISAFVKKLRCVYRNMPMYPMM